MAAAAPKTRRGIRAKSAAVVTQLPHCDAQMIPLSSVISDGYLQFRVDGLDRGYVDQLAEAYADGVQLPPVHVFSQSSELYWVADGHHRVTAANQARLEQIRAVVHEGDRAEARLYALRANGSHGRRRTSQDLAYGYRVIVAEEMCQAEDVGRVMELLGCSRRSAERLTRDARERDVAERNALIRQLAKQGKTQREIAVEVGLTQRAVAHVLSAQKTTESQIEQPGGPEQKTTESQIAQPGGPAPKTTESQMDQGKVGASESNDTESASKRTEAQREEDIRRDVLFLKGQKDLFSQSGSEDEARDEAIRRLERNGLTALEIATWTRIPKDLIYQALASKSGSDERPAHSSQKDGTSESDLSSPALRRAQVAFIKMNGCDRGRFNEWLRERNYL